MRVALHPQRELEIVRGVGAVLTSVDGRDYVDVGISQGACNLGHAHPEVTCAIAAQAHRLSFVSTAARNDVRRRFLDALLTIAPAPLERAFLCNSGTESVEAALKFARDATGRPGFIAARRAFHGRTLGALSVTWKKELRQAFEPLLPDVEFVGLNDEEALKEAVGPRTAAVILEPVQGEGGVHIAGAEFLRTARDLCDANGSLLIFDEVQTGLGRTGRLFACEHSGVAPDVMCLAKSLANGVPSGATLITEAVQERLRGSHQSTFGGNPLASAAGATTLEVLVRERLWERAARLGAAFLKHLRALTCAPIREVRGLGLMAAVELRQRAGPVLARMESLGYLALASGESTVRFLPPLVISPEQLQGAVGAFEEALLRG